MDSEEPLTRAYIALILSAAQDCRALSPVILKPNADDHRSVLLHWSTLQVTATLSRTLDDLESFTAYRRALAHLHEAPWLTANQLLGLEDLAGRTDDLVTADREHLPLEVGITGTTAAETMGGGVWLESDGWHLRHGNTTAHHASLHDCLHQLASLRRQRRSATQFIR